MVATQPAGAGCTLCKPRTSCITAVLPKNARLYLLPDRTAPGKQCRDKTTSPVASRHPICTRHFSHDRKPSSVRATSVATASLQAKTGYNQQHKLPCPTNIPWQKPSDTHTQHHYHLTTFDTQHKYRHVPGYPVTF